MLKGTLLVDYLQTGDTVSSHIANFWINLMKEMTEKVYGRKNLFSTIQFKLLQFEVLFDHLPLSPNLVPLTLGRFQISKKSCMEI